jgi:hypothetical protein
LQPDALQHGLAGALELAEIVAVQFQHAELPFDEQDARFDRRTDFSASR